MKPDFMLHLEATLSILSPCRTWLSLSPGPAEEAKPFWDATFRPTGRSTVEEHFAHLVASGRITDSAPAFLALSARNVLANLRCVGFIRGVTPQPVHALGDTLASARPFYILAGLRSGGLEIALWDGHTPVPDQYDWFVSGVPVVWDGIPPESMLPRIIAESADPSHLWHLPRGEHPEASTGNEERIRKICAVFQKMLASEAGPTAAAILAEAGDLEREDAVAHNLIGLRRDGSLMHLTAIGRLEDLGQRLQALGAVRALCLDNSGSISISYRPAGAVAFKQMWAFPNHRPAGKAMIFLAIGPGVWRLNP